MQSTEYDIYVYQYKFDIRMFFVKKPTSPFVSKIQMIRKLWSKKQTTGKNIIVYVVLDCCRITKASSHTSNAHEHQEEVHKSNIPSVKEDVASSTKLMTLIQTLVDLQV